jgi:ferredoxin-NADP reductase
MKKYFLKSSVWMTKDSLLLTLEPKNSEDKLDFYPGQYLSIGFRRFGRPSPVRCFSIVSSPSSNNLQLGIRVYGVFTKSLSKLKPGANMFVLGPYGNFLIDEEKDKNIIMLAAGIGITPYMSMLRFLSEQRINLPVTLVYAVRTTDNIPFYNEITELQKTNPFLKVIYLVAEDIKPIGNQKFYKGLISSDFMDKLTKKYYSPYTFFICGPKGFKDAAIDILSKNNVEKDKIITEEFTPSTQSRSDAEGEAFTIPKLTYGLSFLSLALLSAFIMTIDLVREVPKLQNSSSTTSAPSASNSSAGNTNTNSTPSPANSQPVQPSSPSTTYSQPQQNQNSYQQPTTSVS